MMRTYSRKRPNNKLIEDVHELCRLCLNKTTEAMPIFSDDKDKVCATLALRIMICVGLEVKREECLPNTICTKCYNDLNKYYEFRKKCEVTYQKLKSHVLAVKEKQYRQRLLSEAENKQKLDNIDNDEGPKYVVTFDKFADINMLNLNSVAVNNFVEKLPDLPKTEYAEMQLTDGTTEEHKLPDLPKTEYPEIQLTDGTTEEFQSQEVDTSDPDITTFLSTMLLELGILTEQEDGLVYTNQNIKSLELETGDGSQIMLELMEEDDVQEQHTEFPTQKETMDESLNTSGEAEDSLQENECIIKYAKSNRHTKNEAKSDKKSLGAWCPECGKRLATRSALTRHLRVHSGERPFACTLCGRTFAQREVLTRHLLVHDETRPHKCSVCQKSFTQRGALVSHERSHAPPAARPLALFRCDRCPKLFLYASGLSRHMMMHNGRVYVCGACERQFKDKSSLLRHLKNANHAPRDNAPT